MDFCDNTLDTASKLKKEYNYLLKDKQEYFTVTVPNENNFFLWKVQINGPPNTPYEGGKFQLTFRFPNEFPKCPPKVKFETAIFHPNVNQSGEVCLEILHEAWQPRITIPKIILAILSLMTFPLTEGAVNPQVARMLENSKEKFDGIARSWTRNYAWAYDASSNLPSTAVQSSSEKDKKSSSDSKSSRTRSKSPKKKKK